VIANSVKQRSISGEKVARCDVIREIPTRKTLQFTGALEPACISGEIQSRRICRLISNPDHFNLPSMAFIILSRPFPAGILMRITYIRAGSHLLHGEDAALGALDACAGAGYIVCTPAIARRSRDRSRLRSRARAWEAERTRGALVRETRRCEMKPRRGRFLTGCLLRSGQVRRRWYFADG
jgi:hypothetical protein